MVYKNGDKYVGSWKNDQFHGNGIFYVTSFKAKYSGTWVNNKLHGQGVMEMEGQLQYKMEYNHGRRIK